MSSEKDFTSASSSTSSEVGRPIVSSSGRRGGRGRGRGGSSSRGRGRGRRSRVRDTDPIDPRRQQELQELQERRTAEMQARLQSLTTSDKDMLLERISARLPGLMLDMLDLQEPSPGAAGGDLHWCTCNNCREMPSDTERLCCRQTPENYISLMAHMQYYILDPGVLRLARAAWNDIFAVDDEQEPGVEQRQNRHAAYRQFVLWQHGRLGEGHRVVIPSCCVWRIRDVFPDPGGNYTGFRVRRLV